MPPKDSKENGKQKTLLGFFAKPNAQTTNPTVKKQTSSSSLASVETKTPKKTGSSSSAVSSVKSDKSTKSTSTTDAIDVDALILDEKADDSDEEGEKLPIATKRVLKRKVMVIDDDDDVDLDAFSQKLAKFKKPTGRSSDASSDVPKPRPSTASQRKKRRTSVTSTDEDDFIAPSDSDEESAAPSRAPSSTKSGTTSGMDVDSDEDLSDEDAPKKKAKSSSKPYRPGQRPAAATKSNSATMFLTAAEQRSQGAKKEKDKKAAETCFDFVDNVRDKDGNREGEPGYDPRTIYVPKKAWDKFTPFEKQFWEIKQNHWDTVLFFQKGKFYELYENDAMIGHTVFDLKMTDRVKMKMVGVPEMSFDLWAGKFLAKGYEVGRVDQAETALGAEMRQAAAKGKSKGPKETIVRRELTKVLTGGTLVDGHMLTDEQAGHCVSIRELDEEDSFGICILDAATGEFNLCSFTDDTCRTKLETVMRQLRPKELVYSKGNLSVPTTRLLKNIIPASCLWTALRTSEGLDYDQTIEALNEMFPGGDEDDAMEDDAVGVRKSTGLPEGIQRMLSSRVAVEAIGSMIWYLRTLKLDKDLLTMRNFNIYDPMKQGLGLVLDGQTLAHIEVLQNNEGTDEGSLLKLLGRCITPFGKRLFRIWLCMPLRDVKDINARLDVVESIMDNEDFEAKFTALAKKLPDMERLVSRVHAGSCKVADFVKLLAAFGTLSDGLQDLGTLASELSSKVLSGLLRSAPVLDKYIKHLSDQYEVEGDKLLPREGKDEAYDLVQDDIAEVKDELDKALLKLTKKLGAKKLEYHHSAVGTKDVYMVQTTSNQKGIPKDWVKTGSTKAVSRWDVPELSGMIRRFKEGQETRNAAIRDFKLRLYMEFDEERDVWLQAVKVMAEIDCLFSLAKASRAIGTPSCRPELVESPEAFIDFEELRHPALCLKNDFIPNNVRMGGDAPGITLLTGANMAGKSTLMRMTAAGIIMAQMGMYVPASKARISPCDTILTRMGAYDNMFSNASTFRVEMDEACKILREATPKSLIVLDELGRGTSTFDGMAIAGAVLHELATHTLGLSLFATHYSSLTEDFAYHPNIRNMHMKTAVDDEKRELVFLYKLTDGNASSSFGTHVANLAGVPTNVVERAEKISQDFALQFQQKLESRRSSSLPLTAQADFAYLCKLAAGELEVDKDLARQQKVLDMIRRAAAAGYVKVA